MNNSGRSGVGVLGFYKLAPAEMLVVHDEIDLPSGDRAPQGGRRCTAVTTACAT